jgi:prepilin peptidase CpaA
MLQFRAVDLPPWLQTGSSLQIGPWLHIGRWFQTGTWLQIGPWIQIDPWIQTGPWIPAVLIALAAGFLDWRYRRIPNWLTVSGCAAGLAVNTVLYRWPGLKAALLGALLGLGVLLPFVLIRSLGAGDWKLAGALGACLGPRQLLSVLVGTILVAGVMALALVIWKGRLKRTLQNIARLLGAMAKLSLHMPGPELSLDDPQSTKIPFGVAMALTVVAYGVGKAMGKL